MSILDWTWNSKISTIKYAVRGGLTVGVILAAGVSVGGVFLLKAAALTVGLSAAGACVLTCCVSACVGRCRESGEDVGDFYTPAPTGDDLEGQQRDRSVSRSQSNKFDSGKGNMFGSESSYVAHQFNTGGTVTSRGSVASDARLIMGGAPLPTGRNNAGVVGSGGVLAGSVINAHQHGSATGSAHSNGTATGDAAVVRIKSPVRSASATDSGTLLAGWSPHSSDGGITANPSKPGRGASFVEAGTPAASEAVAITDHSLNNSTSDGAVPKGTIPTPTPRL